MPFRQVLPILVRLSKVTVSETLVRRLTQRAGAALVSVEDAAVVEIERTQPAAPAGATRQQVSVDGAMVPVKGGLWKEVRTLVVGELSATEPGKAGALSYFSRLQDAERYTRLATGELQRRGSFAASQVVAVVDGAVWCQHFIDYHLPDAIRILDFPHAVEHLGKASQAVFGAGSAAHREWLAGQMRTLHQGDPQTVIAAVAALPVDNAIDPVLAAEVRDKVHVYLASRSAQITYADFLAQGFPIGSGVVESANKLLVEARLKGPGMHWAIDHVDPILALRGAIFSQRWPDAWQQISRQRRQQAHRSSHRTPPAKPPATILAEPVPTPPLIPTSSPRAKTIVQGKPTRDHPWKQRFLVPSGSPQGTITKT